MVPYIRDPAAGIGEMELLAFWLVLGLMIGFVLGAVWGGSLITGRIRSEAVEAGVAHWEIGPGGPAEARFVCGGDETK